MKNIPNDPNSALGRWAYYDFHSIMPEGRYYLLTATSPSLPLGQLETFDVSASAQDLISDEIGDTTFFDGVTSVSLAFADPLLGLEETTVRAVHFTELRERIDALRITHGLAAHAWTDVPLTPGVTVIKAIHLIEMRTALAEVYTAVSVTPPAYLTPTVSPS